MGWADKVGSAEVSKGGTYPLPGVYPVIQVDVLKVVKSRKGDDLFIAELDILKSEVENRQPGTSMSWMANLTKHEAAAGNVKALLAALANIPEEDVDSTGAASAVSEQNPFRGRLVRLQAEEITTKEDKPFTKCKWVPIAEEGQSKAKDIRQEAGFDTF